MTDLMKGQAAWNDYMRIQGAEFQALNRIKAAWRSVRGMRSSVLVEFDEQESISVVDLDGDAIIGTNTDEDGFLYGTMTSGATPTLALYSDDAKTALVASGTIASGMTSTLNEKNSSILDNVQITMNTGGFAADSDLRFQVTQDLQKLMDTVYADGSDEARNEAKVNSKNQLKTLASQLAAQYVSRRNAFVTGYLRTFAVDFLAMTVEDLATNNNAQFQYSYSIVNGQVTLGDRRGIMAVQRQSMLDESTPGAQSVLQATPTSGNLTPDSGNTGGITGEGTAASSAISLVLSQHAREGTLVLRCTAETLGRTQFSVENSLAEELIAAPVGRPSTHTKAWQAQNSARVGQSYQDEYIGATFTMQYKDPVESGDAGDILSATTIANHAAADADDGNYYTRTQKSLAIASGDSADQLTLTFYRDNARTITRGSVNVLGFSGVTSGVEITLDGGSVVTTNVHNANADTQLPLKSSTDDAAFDVDPPKLGDKLTVAITQAVSGSDFQDAVAENFGGNLPSNAAPTIDESYAKTFPILPA